MNIATSPTRDRFPLSPKKIWKKTLSQCLIWIILLVILYVVLTLIFLTSDTGKGDVGILTIVFFILGLLIFLPIYFYQRWYFAVYYYDLNNDYIVIRKGPITPSEITIPYERIQDVYVDQDLMDRFFGLYDVHISSATYSSGVAAHIDGVEKPGADGLRAILLDTVRSRISKHSGVGNVVPSMPPPPPAR